MPPLPPLVGRDAELAQLREALAVEPLVYVRGGYGSGRTALARTALPEGALLVSLAGCHGAEDGLRAIGHALGVVPWGDERTVQDELRRRAPCPLGVDDAEHEGLEELFARLVAGVPGLTILAVTTCLPAAGPGAAPVVAVGPLADPVLASLFPGADVAGAAGMPLRAELSAALGVPVAALPAAVVDAAAYAFPAGLPGTPPVGVPPVLFRDDPRRAWLRAGVLEMLGGGAGVPARAAAAALATTSSLLALANGAHLDTPPDPRDILLLRQLAQALPTAAGARCAAAAARLLVIAGQVGAARALLRERPPGSGVDSALLGWADGDALLASGDVDGAVARWREAAELLRRGGDRTTRAQLLRRSADRLLARGALDDAEPMYRLARAAYRAGHHDVGVAATLRGIADLSVASGELMAAATLQDEVELLLGDLQQAGAPLRVERASLLLGQATLWLARGEHARAERLLDSLAALAPRHPLLAANVARRRADLFLRRAQPDRAAGLAADAAAAYLRLGEPVAAAAAHRVTGEAHAMAGRLPEAVAALRRAMELQIGAQDLAGLARTLGRLASVEEARGNPAAARRRREQERALTGDPTP